MHERINSVEVGHQAQDKQGRRGDQAQVSPRCQGLCAIVAHIVHVPSCSFERKLIGA
jgi:hypothetical protein